MDAIAVRTSFEPEKVTTYYDAMAMDESDTGTRLRALQTIESEGYDVDNMMQAIVAYRRQQHG